MWLQEPPPQDTADPDDQANVQGDGGEGERQGEQEHTTTVSIPESDIRPEKPVPPTEQPKGGLRIWALRYPHRTAFALTALCAAFILSGLYAFQTQLVHAWPPIHALYDRFGLEGRSLPLIDIRMTIPKITRAADGKTLTAHIELTNVGRSSLTLPWLKAEQVDEAGHPLAAWHIASPQKSIAPEETVHITADYPADEKATTLTLTLPAFQ